MSDSTLFLIMSIMSGLGWFAIVVMSPWCKRADKFVISVIVAILACAYGYFNFANLGDVGGITAFLSYEGVEKVFANSGLQLAAWAHILGIDLLAGVWMLYNSRRYKIRHRAMILIYLVTIVLGPIGVLIYLFVRALHAGSWFAENE